MIRPTGFFRNKTTSLIKLGQALVERFDGEVPRTLNELVTLPGFGRKTANVVLGNAFGVPGITVDTHFGRLARRWAWTAETDPVKVEQVVAELIPKRTGRSCRTASSGTAGGSATPASPPAAPARSPGCARPSAPARPTRRSRRSWSRSPAQWSSHGMTDGGPSGASEPPAWLATPLAAAAGTCGRPAVELPAARRRQRPRLGGAHRLRRLASTGDRRLRRCC